MNGILGFAQLLKEPGLNGDDQQKYIAVIEKSGARMLNIINDIIDISKIEAGLVSLEMKESDPNEQMEYIQTFFKPEIEAKRLNLVIDCGLPSKKSIIITDREKLYAILTNLVKNAIKFTTRGSIRVGYRKKDEFLEFYVKDTGIGIPGEKQKDIFERFIQLNPTGTHTMEGTGLGLSISKAYVEMLGGNIWFESQEGVGTTFYFTIPYLTSNPEPGSVNPDDANVNQNFQVAYEPGLKILIAEDDEVSASLLSIALKSVGREFITVNNGKEAVEICRKNPDIDLVLMDVRLPILDGHEAVTEIRRFNKEMIIIAQTAYGLKGDREKALKAGCNDYIAKPVDKDLLISLIEKYFFD
jgi:CheY-like chemotaxis protein/two-component sensor histidine kinase